mgnify:CR=1 FL=1
MTVFLCTLLFGCTDEPEYDLSQIPIKENEGDKKRAGGQPTDRAVAPDEEGQPTGDIMDLATDTCAPPENHGPPLTSENSLTMTVALDSKALGHQVMIDVIESEHGELKYGVVCKGQNPSFSIPKMLGTVRVAVFVDADKNGPSKADAQGMSNIITITDNDIEIPTVEWMSTPISFYHFENKDRDPADPIQDIPAGDDQ